MRNFSRDFADKSYNNDNYSRKKTTYSGDVLGLILLSLVWGGIAIQIIIEATT